MVEEYYGPDNIISRDSLYTIVKISFPLDEWVYSHILGYGEMLEILEPAHLREKIAEKINKMHKFYSNLT